MGIANSFLVDILYRIRYTGNIRNEGKHVITVYYIKTPNGRQKIMPVPANDAEAFEAFKNHWSARATWSCDGKRVLVKETKEEILIEEIKKS